MKSRRRQAEARRGRGRPRWLAITRRAGSTRYDALLDACEMLASVYGSRPKALLAIAEASPLYADALRVMTIKDLTSVSSVSGVKKNMETRRGNKNKRRIG